MDTPAAPTPATNQADAATTAGTPAALGRIGDKRRTPGTYQVRLRLSTTPIELGRRHRGDDALAQLAYLAAETARRLDHSASRYHHTLARAHNDLDHAAQGALQPTGGGLARTTLDLERLEAAIDAQREFLDAYSDATAQVTPLT